MEDEVAIHVHGVFPVPMGIGREDRQKKTTAPRVVLRIWNLIPETLLTEFS